MTISTEVRKAGPFEGNDATVVFPFAFKIFKAADLVVVQRNEFSEQDTTLTLTTDYAVTLNADQNATPGGFVTLTAGPLAFGLQLVISSALPLLQETDLTNQGGFYPKVITNALDRLTIFCQQLQESVSRAIRLPITAPNGVQTELPFPKASNVIGWDESASSLRNFSPQEIATVAAYGNTIADQFTGDGSTTVFTLSSSPGSLNNMDVSVNGVTQRPIFDYSWDYANHITFAVAPPAPGAPGAKNILVRHAEALPQTDNALREELAAAGGSALVNGSAIPLVSVTALRASQARYDGDLRFLLGYRAGSIKGAGVFKWVASSTVADDGGAVVAVSGVPTGRWVRQVEGPYTPEMYGADGTKTNDPNAIYRLLSNQKNLRFSGGKYYYNQEFVTNGHTITGVAAETFDVSNTGTHIVFFGNFSADQAYRNEGKKTVLKGIVFEPESWDVINGYTGIGMRLFRGVDAENCCWNKFKKFGMDLWEDVANAYVPYYSQFRNCSWDYNGYSGIRLAQGANALQIYGGTCRWNGAPSYGTAPSDSSTGWDGLFIGHVVEAGVPAPDNPYSTQGLIIEGIDCAYNARYGANLNYCNQSRIHIGYCEDNKQGKDIRIADVIACDINILQSQQGADIVVPTRGYGVPRSDANYPNRIVVNGQYYGSGSKDAQGRYNDYGNNPKQGVTMLAAGSVGACYLRARVEGDGSVEFLADGNVQILYRCPPVSGLPTAGEKWLGVIVRNTSSGPNPLQVCVESSPGVYVWRTITTS